MNPSVIEVLILLRSLYHKLSLAVVLGLKYNTITRRQEILGINLMAILLQSNIKVGINENA